MINTIINKIVEVLKRLNRRKLFIVLSIVFFPVTIIFSPIIILLVDIISKQRVIIEDLAKIRSGDNKNDKISETLENILLTLISKN
jgi:predicted PurR-regulated permease PerM